MVNRKSSTDFINPFSLFLLSPFAALVASIRYSNQRWAKNIFWFFCTFFGFTMVVVFTGDVSEGSDSVRYAEWFKSMSQQDITSSNFIDLVYSASDSDESNYLDIVQPLVSFLLSRITGDYHILFGSFAFILGYFYSRNVWYLLERCKGKHTFVLILFITVFTLLNPIWNISVFRFAAATHLFLFGTLPYLIEGKKAKIYIAALSVLMHFTFILPVLILLIYVFIGNRTKLFFVFFILTSLLQESNFLNINDTLESLPRVFQSKVKTYTTEDEDAGDVERNNLNDSVNWYVRYYNAIQKWIVYILIVFIYFKGKILYERNRIFVNLFCFSMFFYSFANMATVLPQGSRFYLIANMIVFFFIIYYGTNSKLEGKRIINSFGKVLSPLLILIILVSLRRGFDNLGIFSIIGNPFILPFIKFDMPLIDLIK